MNKTTKYLLIGAAVLGVVAVAYVILRPTTTTNVTMATTPGTTTTGTLASNTTAQGTVTNPLYASLKLF